MNILLSIKNFFLHPHFFWNAVEKKNFSFTMVFIVLSQFLISICFCIAFIGFVKVKPDLNIKDFSFFTDIFFALIILYPLMLLMISSFVHFCIKLFKCNGTFKQTFKLIIWSFILFLLFTPISGIILTIFNYCFSLNMSIYYFFCITSLFTTIYFYIGLKTINKTSNIRAFFILLASYLIIFGPSSCFYFIGSFK